MFTSKFHHSVKISLLDVEQVSWCDLNQTNQLILQPFACPCTKSRIAFCNCFKPHLNQAHFFFFFFFKIVGISFNGMLEPKKKLQLCRKPNKIPVRAQCVSDNLSAGTNQPCPGLCARGHWGLLSVSELRQCLSVLNTGPDRGKSKNKLTCGGAITSP